MSAKTVLSIIAFAITFVIYCIACTSFGPSEDPNSEKISLKTTDESGTPREPGSKEKLLEIGSPRKLPKNSTIELAVFNQSGNNENGFGFPLQNESRISNSSQAQQDTSIVSDGREQQSSPNLIQSLASASQMQLSDEDRHTLQSLPPVCTSDLPGIAGTFNSNSPESANPAGLKPKDQNSNSPLNPAEPGIGETLELASYNPHAKSSASKVEPGRAKLKPGEDPHAAAFSRSMYPSAAECRECHQQIYDEWAGSSHAYAAISPMFQRFEDTVNKLAQGTIGYFCMRCHAPVATTLKLRRDQAIWDGPKVFREGVTCVACHRVKEAYNKTNGERRIEPGDIYQPVYASGDGIGVEKAIKYKDYFKVKSNPNQPGPGQPIHRRSIKFEQLSKSSFCMSCHQVAVQPGIKLEVVWDQYRASPAYRQGITCQECHMGKVPGLAEGYTIGPAAVMSGKVVNADRKHSNHMFYGPGYSIAHPGIFPFTQGQDRWSVNQWLQFDWRGGWGTPEFENRVADGSIQTAFPPAWQEVDDRIDAREIVDVNLKKLAYKKDLRRQLLENGSKIDGPFFAKNPALGSKLKFHYCLTNKNSGHNMPSGSLGAQPQLWLNVVLMGPDGKRLWESGYLDSNGDLADQFSLDVRKRRAPLDKQLFNLQTKFLVTNVKGTDRQWFLPINFDFDQLPFLRPAIQPVSVINHPPFIRMEAHSIPPLGKRKAKYIVPAHLIRQPGIYRLSVRMRSRAEPIYFMRFVKSTPEMERMMNEWIVDVHAYTVAFEVK